MTTEDPARARLRDAALRLSVPLDPGVATELVALLRSLLAEPQNLTAIRDEDEAVDRHLADSLAALAVPLGSGPVCDIGSGGGMPGLVLAHVLAPRPVTLVESEGRKAQWLERASGQMPHVRVVAERTEDFAAHEREAFGLVTARAVAPPIPTLELAAPLVAPGGRLVVWSTSDAAAEWAAAAEPAALLGFGPAAHYDVTPFRDARRRLMLFDKHSPTPGAYPRRPGRATKRPLAPGRPGST